MIHIFLFHMKMVLAGLKILTLKVRVTIIVVTMVLMQQKHRSMGIGFIQQNMVFLVMQKTLQKGFHQKTSYQE